MQGKEGNEVGQREPTNRWPVEQRLEFIDFRLYWDGRVNRSDLVDYFGVSVPQASADLARYHQSAPANLVYDKSAKTYVAGSRFKPAFFTPSADGYLAQLRLLASGILSEEQSLVAEPSAYYVMPMLRRRLDPETLRRIVHCMQNALSLEVKYYSLRRKSPIWRWIAPHALGFDGFRWHLRAWCHERGDFRDFVIARVLDVRDSKESQVDFADDIGWHQEVTLKIGPNPRLSAGAREAIEIDYGMVNGVIELKTRACLSVYVERFLGLDLDPEASVPERQQIVLLNRDEVAATRTS